MVYNVDNCGYFGLVLKCYVYFMLLICRYFDLLLYWVIKYLIVKELGIYIDCWILIGGFYYLFDDMDYYGE